MSPPELDKFYLSARKQGVSFYIQQKSPYRDRSRVGSSIFQAIFESTAGSCRFILCNKVFLLNQTSDARRSLPDEKLEVLQVLDLEVEHVCSKRMLLMVGPC